MITVNITVSGETVDRFVAAIEEGARALVRLATLAEPLLQSFAAARAAAQTGPAGTAQEITARDVSSQTARPAEGLPERAPPAAASLPVVFTEERKALIRKLRREGTPLKDMFAAVNRLPGRPVASPQALYQKLKAMGLGRQQEAAAAPEAAVTQASPAAPLRTPVAAQAAARSAVQPVPMGGGRRVRGSDDRRNHAMGGSPHGFLHVRRRAAGGQPAARKGRPAAIPGAPRTAGGLA